MKTKYLIIAILLIVTVVVITGSGCILFKKKAGTATGSLKVSIDARNAGSLGSLELTLTYDPTIIQAVSVEKGTLAANASLEYSADKPGKVWVGMVDAGGINGSGALAVINFDITGIGDKASALDFEKVIANKSTNLMEINTQTTPGSVNIKSKAVKNPALAFSP